MYNYVLFCYIVSTVPLKGEQSLSDVKNMIHKLYTSLNVDSHQVTRWVWFVGMVTRQWVA